MKHQTKNIIINWNHRNTGDNDYRKYGILIIENKTQKFLQSVYQWPTRLKCRVSSSLKHKLSMKDRQWASMLIVGMDYPRKNQVNLNFVLLKIYSNWLNGKIRSYYNQKQRWALKISQAYKTCLVIHAKLDLAYYARLTWPGSLLFMPLEIISKT